MEFSAQGYQSHEHYTRAWQQDRLNEAANMYHLTRLVCQCGRLTECEASGPQAGVTPPCSCGLPIAAPGDHQIAPNMTLLRAGNGLASQQVDPAIEYGHTRVAPILNLNPTGEQDFHVTRHFWITATEFVTVRFKQCTYQEEVVTWLMRHWWVWRLEGATFRYMLQENFAAINSVFFAGVGHYAGPRIFEAGFELFRGMITAIRSGTLPWMRPLDIDDPVRPRIFEAGAPVAFVPPPGTTPNERSRIYGWRAVCQWCIMVANNTTTIASPLALHDMDAYRLDRVRVPANMPDEFLHGTDNSMTTAFNQVFTWPNPCWRPAGLQFSNQGRQIQILWMKRLAVYTLKINSSPQWEGTMASFKIT